MNAIPQSAKATPGAAQMGAAGLRAFVRIAEHWGLSVDEQLRCSASRRARPSSPGASSPKRRACSRDTLERLSNLLGIYKSLQILLPDAAAADAWVRKPNAAPLFGGRSRAGPHAGRQRQRPATLVRRYLDAARGGGWS